MADDMHVPVFNIMYRSGVNSGNNGALLQRGKEETNILHKVKRGKANWIGHIRRSNCLLTRPVTEGEMEGRIGVTGRRGRRRKQLLDYLKEQRGYRKLKEGALNCPIWRTRVRRCRPVLRRTTELMTFDTSRKRGLLSCRKYVFYQPL